jgi:hypothetical protein
MFAFLSNRLGCLGSIVVSVIGTLILLAALRQEVCDKEVNLASVFTEKERFARSKYARQPDELCDPVHRGEQSILSSDLC